MAIERMSTATSKMNGGESDGSMMERLLVAMRIRPLRQDEILRGESRVAHAVEDKMVVLVDPLDDRIGVGSVGLRQKHRQERQYVFDVVFDAVSAQANVYKWTTKPLVDTVMEGCNATVFAYGATGSGKTYTMVGTDKEPGIMVRALNDLFQRVKDTPNELACTVTMSYLEIYNEMIRDLLNPSSGYLELREEAGKIQVTGLTQISTTSTDDVIKLLSKGNRARTMESTAANQTSSRSHALLEVNVRQYDRIENVRKSGKLYMIDLAGSERASNTKNRGKRLVEGAHINRSLLALGNCINALASKDVNKYINYRDSKLTRLLKEALSGNCRTVMIAHISPASAHFDESRNTLVYADRAKNIRNKVQRNEIDVPYHMAQYQMMIDELRQEIDRLRMKMNTDSQEERNGPNKGNSRKMSPELVKKLKEDLIKSFHEQMDLRRHLMEIDTHVLSLSIEFEKKSMVVKQWELEKLKRTSSRDEQLSSSFKEENEPQYVRRAWDELVFIQDEQQRYWEMRQDIELQFRECQSRSIKMEEELPSKVNNAEQRELLSLLCKVYELEIEKMEMQAATMLREHELRRKDMILMRYDRQRNLTDEIISKQKAIIATLAHGSGGNNIECPPELQHLYKQYRVEMDGMSSRPEGSSAQSPVVKKSSAVNLQRSNIVRRARPTGSHLPRLKQEPLPNKIYLQRGYMSDTAAIQQKRKPLTTSSSSTSNVVLPPIETGQSQASTLTTTTTTATTPENQMRDSLRTINAVAARRRSIRTADRQNVQAVYNGGPLPRGSSVTTNHVTHPSVKGPLKIGSSISSSPSPVLHKRTNSSQSPSRQRMSLIPNSGLHPDFGFGHPKPAIYHPPTFQIREKQRDSFAENDIDGDEYATDGSLDQNNFERLRMALILPKSAKNQLAKIN